MPFGDLPENLRQSYAVGFKTILSDLEKVRYQHLSLSQLIESYHFALAGGREYKLYAECLNYHKNNIRWDDVLELLGRLGLCDAAAWINTHPALIRHLNARSKVVELTAGRLKDFVQYRNDAAHGSVSVGEILGPSKLLEYLDFLQALSEGLNQYIASSALHVLLDRSVAPEVGVVTETYSGNIVVANMQGVTIAVNEGLFAVTKRECVTVKIVSLMINDEAKEKLVIARAQEIGLGLSSTIAKGARLIKIPPAKKF
jgi:hypothetical protein